MQTASADYKPFVPERYRAIIYKVMKINSSKHIAFLLLCGIVFCLLAYDILSRDRRDEEYDISVTSDDEHFPCTAQYDCKIVDENLIIQIELIDDNNFKGTVSFEYRAYMEDTNEVEFVEAASGTYDYSLFSFTMHIDEVKDEKYNFLLDKNLKFVRK